MEKELTEITGAKGDKGDTGAQGPAGADGKNGTNGKDGNSHLSNVSNIAFNKKTGHLEVTIGKVTHERLQMMYNIFRQRREFIKNGKI